jgi:hypothetical protein
MIFWKGSGVLNEINPGIIKMYLMASSLEYLQNIFV